MGPVIIKLHGNIPTKSNKKQLQQYDWNHLSAYEQEPRLQTFQPGYGSWSILSSQNTGISYYQMTHPVPYQVTQP